MIEDAEERSTDTKIEPSKTPTLEGCPCCAGDCKEYEATKRVYCISDCGYRVAGLATHNHLAEYVRLGKLVEKFKENPPRGPYGGYDHRNALGDCYREGVQACLDMLKVDDT